MINAHTHESIRKRVYSIFMIHIVSSGGSSSSKNTLFSVVIGLQYHRSTENVETKRIGAQHRLPATTTIVRSLIDHLTFNI